MLQTVCVGILLLLATCAGAQSSNAIAVGEAIHATLSEGSTDEYRVALKAGTFVYAELEQSDFDGKVTVVGPRGVVIDTFDDLALGADAIQFETQIIGDYIFVVEGAAGGSGDYRLELERAEPIAEDPVARLDQLLASYSGSDRPGAIVAVVRNGKVVHHQAVGMSSLVYGMPFTRKTRSNIGSVSKQFTAFAITKLAMDGLIGLDDDVRDYFPTIPDLGHAVTVRQLLNHTNGYREFLRLLSMSGRRLKDGDYVGRDEVLHMLERQPTLQDVPGTRFNYNNTAYVLAALLVEEVTGQPFHEWLDEHVFTPLGMQNTRLRAHTGEIVPNASEGYIRSEKAPYRISVDFGGGGGIAMGPGGIYTTVDDFAKWLGNMATGRVGGEAVVREMMRPQVETPGEGNYYGLGLALSKYRGLDLVSHGGADTAHRAQMWYLPEIDAGIIAMSNNARFDGGMVAQVADAFFAEHLGPESAVVGTIESTADGVSDIPPASFRRFAGQYELVDYPGIVYRVWVDGDGVYVEGPGGEARPATPVSDSSLRVGPNELIQFEVGETGVVESLTIASDRNLQALKLEEWEPKADALAEYAGRYFSAELGTFYEIVLDGTGLLARHRRLDDMEMTPKVSDTFKASGPVSEVKFVRDVEGAIEGFMASNVRTLNVWFERQD